MPGIVESSQLVQQAVEGFGDLFYGEPGRRHFAEYLTGLFIAERKTVSSINREFARTTDQSCLNRFLTEMDWDARALNERRLDFFQQDSTTRYSEQGVIAIDNVLIDHAGQCIEDVGWFWDHAEGRNKIAHDYLFANYVYPGGKQELGMGDCQLRSGEGRLELHGVQMSPSSLGSMVLQRTLLAAPGTAHRLPLSML